MAASDCFWPIITYHDRLKSAKRSPANTSRKSKVIRMGSENQGQFSISNDSVSSSRQGDGKLVVSSAVLEAPAGRSLSRLHRLL